MKKFLFIVLTTLLLAGCKGDGGGVSSYSKEIKVGGPAVDFLYRDMDEVPFRLSEQKGKVVILYFWRMKCAECKEELKSLEALHGRYKDRGLVIVSVGADTMHSSPISEVKAFMDGIGVTFVRLRDSEGFVSEAYQVLKAPQAYIIDRDGNIASIVMERTDWTGEKAAIIEDLLSK